MERQPHCGSSVLGTAGISLSDLTLDPGRLVGKKKNTCTNRYKFQDIQVPREVEGTTLQRPEMSTDYWDISERGSRSEGGD